MQPVLLFSVFCLTWCVVATNVHPYLDIIEYSFKWNNIVPEVIPVGPPKQLEVTYLPDNFITDSQIVDSYTMEEKPMVNWTGRPERFNMVVMLDLDAPSFGHETGRERVHWLVVNIEGNDITSGETVVEYVGIFEKTDSEPHRFVILMYLQPWIVEYKLKCIGPE